MLRFRIPRFAVNPRLRNGRNVIGGIERKGAAKRPRLAEGSKGRPALRKGHPVASLYTEFWYFLMLSVT